MTRPRPWIASELLPVLLILACLGGSFSLVVTMHRRGAAARKEKDRDRAATTVAQAHPPKPIKTPPAPAPSEPPPPAPTPQPPPPPAEDPTEKALTQLRLAQTEQVLEAQKADRKAAALEAARLAALADSERWRRREALVRTQIEKLTDQATRLGDEMQQMALERDVLARERDAEKAALARARTRSSYAVLPHKGPNGTWRRPIIIECYNGMATLQPEGRSFSLLELSGLLGPQSSPVVAAVASEAVRAQAQSSPDGAPIVPYIFFVIRPDGIRSYYSARAQLEPLGIAFGYELVDQNMEIDYPDLDHLDEWDGSAPSRPRATEPPIIAEAGEGRPWPSTERRGTNGKDDPVNSFVWPTRPSGGLAGNGLGGSPTGGPGRESSDPGGGDLGVGGGGLGVGGRGGGDVAPARGLDNDLRDGLGRGGSGVDPIPNGIPLLGGGSPRGSLDVPPAGTGPGPGGRTGGEEPRFGRRPGLIPVDPEGLPGLTSPDAPGAAEGNPAPAPATSPEGGRSGRLDIVSAPDNRPGSPTGLGSAPGLGSPASAAAGGSPVAGLTGRFDPNRGAPPPLSQLARLAGAPGPTGANRFGLPMPLPLPMTDGERMDPNSGQGMGAGAGAGSGEDGPRGGSRAPGSLERLDRDGPTKVEVPFEIVVACSPSGVVIHPGGYRLSVKALKSKDDLLVKHLRTIIQARRQVDPSIRPRPSIRFLIEPGGSEAYRDARRQTLLSGQDWPIALQVSDSSILDNFPREPW